ncbi:MAG: metallophosphoesterase family protein [Tepidisphaerales bacterium]
MTTSTPPSPPAALPRRHFLQSAVAAGGLVVMAEAGGHASRLAPELSGRPADNRRRVLRVAHLTDTHLDASRRKSDEGLIACLRHVGEHFRPDLILAGGDNIREAFNVPEDVAAAQFEQWRRLIRAHSPAPVVHCIGNHDVWGWDKANSQTTGNEPRFGKAWAVEAFELPNRYYAFDRAGWHFVVLDSTFPHDEGYKGRLDDEQFEWLERDLAATPPTTPVLVLSHIPIVSAAALFDGENEKTGDWVVPGAWVHIDARRIKDLFYRHRNFKLALSGHLHLVERVEYLGVHYICDGAVSGGWWKGPYHEFDTGYGVIDLYDDGSFDWAFVVYPWTPQP